MVPLAARDERDDEPPALPRDCGVLRMAGLGVRERDAVRPWRRWGRADGCFDW